MEGEVLRQWWKIGGLLFEVVKPWVPKPNLLASIRSAQNERVAFNAAQETVVKIERQWKAAVVVDKADVVPELPPPLRVSAIDVAHHLREVYGYCKPSAIMNEVAERTAREWLKGLGLDRRSIGPLSRMGAKAWRTSTPLDRVLEKDFR